MTWEELRDQIKCFDKTQLKSEIQGYGINTFEGYTKFTLKTSLDTIGLDQYGVFDKDTFDDENGYYEASQGAYLILPPNIPYFTLL